MAIRLIAIDIDGTLVDSRWQVPEANAKAIVEAASRGIEVVLVTGRRFDFARPVAEQVPCDLTMIINNGALIKSKSGATHLRHLLPREIARQVLEATPQFRSGAAVVFDRLRENQVVFEHIDWDDPGRHSYFRRNREFLAQISPLEECLDEDPIQVMFSGSVGRMREVAAALKPGARAGQYTLAITEYEERDFAILDVVQHGCTKGTTLAEWTALRGLGREDVLAIGDNLNDREMLEFAGKAVVMGNCVPELKNLGWPVTLCNDDAGVALAIEDYALR